MAVVVKVLPHHLKALGRGDGGPLFFTFDLRIAKELPRLGVQEDRVTRDAVVLEDLLQFRPDRIVAPFVFLFGAGVDRHNEGFADFHELSVYESK